MVFHSPTFLFLFLPLCLALHFIVPKRFRNVVLLFASLLFYSWGEPKAVAVMLVSIASNYAYGRWLDSAREREASDRKLRTIVGVAVVTNLGLLIAFKYANWLWDQAQTVLASLGFEETSRLELGHIPLPVGISFFTFQALSYIVDLYRKQGEVQRKPLDFALYIALFPQLIAGPIVRYRDVALQIRERTVVRRDFAEGVRRFLIGLGKKVLIADLCALPADYIFDTVPQDQLSMSVAWLGVVCFAIQLYFDFSGYSDMAIGLSRMFGFRLLENFQWPYISRSITEYWRRWHISLSSWFRDYLYIPLGGSRRGPVSTYFNLFTVFLLCGLWHGAAWNFVAFGMCHGIILVIERAGLSKLMECWPRPLQHVYFLFTILTSYVVFRAPTLSNSYHYLSAMFGFGDSSGLQTLGLYLDRELSLALGLGILGSMPWLAAVWKWRNTARERGTSRVAYSTYDIAETLALLGLLVLVAIQISASRYSPFIYFRF